MIGPKMHACLERLSRLSAWSLDLRERLSPPARNERPERHAPEHHESHGAKLESSDLAAIVGDAAMVALADEFGGRRLYVPVRVGETHRIVRTIGMDAAQRLCDRCQFTVIRIPLARDLRAAHYRARGWSNAKIAKHLGLSENGVAGIFKRLARQIESRSKVENDG